MKYPFFASFLILCALFYHNIKKSSRNDTISKQAFWDRENKANNTRKQPLDKLDYIRIPLDRLPTDICTDDETIKSCLSDLRILAEESIVNFTGITNTDLKLEYGAANLPFLQKCDLSYTHLTRVLDEWSSRLLELNQTDEALTVLEYAVEIKADISNIYYKAADIYLERNTPDKINHLIDRIASTNSIIKKSIISNLENRLDKKEIQP